MTEKRRTTVYLNGTLRDLALTREVNLSRLLEDSLKYALEVSDERETLVSEKDDLLKRLAVLNSKLEEVEALERKMTVKKEKQFFEKTVDDLRKKVQLNFSDLAVRKHAIDILATKFGLSRSDAMRELGL